MSFYISSLSRSYRSFGSGGIGVGFGVGLLCIDIVTRAAACYGKDCGGWMDGWADGWN